MNWAAEGAATLLLLLISQLSDRKKNHIINTCESGRNLEEKNSEI
jgi:hypothetical protein